MGFCVSLLCFLHYSALQKLDSVPNRTNAAVSAQGVKGTKRSVEPSAGDDVLDTDVDECDTNRHGCDHVCINTIGSYQCSCRPGFVMHTGGNTCTDIDECAEGTSQCSQKCTNTIGSYTCSCQNGYVLGPDNFICINLNECSGFLNGGCEDECINTVGSFVCKCSGNSTLNEDGLTCSGSTRPSVFSKYGLLRRFLPRGCSTILLAKCDEGTDIKILLSSTSSWYSLKTDPGRIYTYGIVFVEANAIALPVSVSGLEVVKRIDDFKLITGSLTHDVNDGIQYGEERLQYCWTFDTTPRDVRDFLVSNSFLSSFFGNIESSLPDWLQFSPNGNEILGVNDLQTELSRGDDIQNTECQGAPLYSERLYTVLKFGNSFALSIYGQKVTLPTQVSNKKFCIIIDICQDYGGSVFLILPQRSRDILDRFDMFRKLINDSGVYIRPIGVGLSLQKHINVHAKTTHLQQWNGDEIIQYPVFQEANIWIGGDVRMDTDIFRISGTANAFLSIPSPKNEWGFVVRLQAVSALEFTFNTPFGDQTIRGSGSGEVNALASLGGSHERNFCGLNANPAGVFMSVLFNAEAFLDASLLRFIRPGVNVKAYVFLASDPKTPAHNQTLIDVAKEVLDLKHISERFVNLSRDVLARYHTLLSNHSTILLNTVITTGQNLIAIAEDVIQDIGNLNIPNLQQVIQRITVIWKDGWKQLQNDTDAFLDSIRENTQIVKHNITQLIKEETNAIRKRVNILISNVTAQASKVLKEINGAGFRFKGDLDISGLKIIGLEIELVYSIDSLGACSRFERAYSVLKGERAARVLAVVSSGLVKIGPFLRIDAGVGIGLAISVDSNGKFATLIRVEAKFLGIGAQTDLFITNQGLYIYIEGKVWNTFKAQLQISAELGNEWYKLSYGVKGSFVADADGDGSFDDGYLAALRRFTKNIAEDANKRISKLQDGVTKAQRGLTSAQDWLEDKKSIFRKANSKFDDAVRALDKAKDKLEDAKKPFQDALNKLKNAQRKVDRLCRIKDCKKICVPGIKCKICHKRVWGVRIPYPCCKFTSCMISLPDPICLGLNLLCRAARGIAYLALEAAKVFVRIPMLALDAAKVAVSAAQFIVDKSRVVLDIAIAALDLAKLGLEATKGILEGAKLALEAVKQVVKLGVAALNLIIKYGLESIIDVRNCGFEVILSSHDKAVFDVHCDVNAFKTGFKTIKIRINFNDIFHSLWYAAKATISAILDSIGDIFGRKRREIEYNSINLLYKHYRKTRETHVNATETLYNETIDIIADTLDFTTNQTDNEYGIRTEIFLQNCIKFTNIHTFLFDTINALHDIANETASTIINSTFVQDDILSKDSRSLANASLADLGIDLNVAETEFNISLTELTEAIDIAKANLSSDFYLSDVERFSKHAASMLQNQTDDANSLEMVNYWVVAMENVTSEYFNEDTCVSFLDCAHYAVASLYEIVLPPTNLPFKNQSLQSISAFEDIFLILTNNYSLKVLEVYEMSLGLLNHLRAINESNVFCSTPPTTMNPLENQTVVVGQALHLICNVTGSPPPTFIWFKDNEQITDSSTNMIWTIQIDATTETDDTIGITTVPTTTEENGANCTTNMQLLCSIKYAYEQILNKRHSP
ncbi:FBLN5-like protein [Mya arenaria]|uniref:FBLN5-like protein n=1 Tax=Mya arenaria TaxID=6604 RepID=A0ABY7G4E2_MYAAR|nr:FBLN5-like protein [Mya arenaria]